MDFEALFREYFEPLGRFVMPIVKDAQAAEDVVQEVFIKLWERRDKIQIDTSQKAYLYRSAYNTALNYLDKQKREMARMEVVREEMETASSPEPHEPGYRVKQLHAAIEQLPPRCKMVFHLSKFEGMRYQDIADKLDISVKTVENQMGKALKLIRAAMKLLFWAVIIFLKEFLQDIGV